MCEIFAICSRRPVNANMRLREFYAHSVDHPHGWGLAWREEDSIQVFKESLPAIDSNYLRYLLEEPIRASQLVGHIRNATKGIVSIQNCHPFIGNDETGTEWVIAHNGTIINSALIQGYDELEIGQTDSEQVVLFLMDLLNEAALRNGGHLDFSERFVVLSHAFASLSVENKLNLVLNDGTYTYVHTNTVRDTLFSSQVGQTTYFCTVPLNDGGDWKPVLHCRLIAYRDGQMVRVAAAHNYYFDDDGYLERLGIMLPVA
ncbi:MAG: class II glutamine amidotransferase [Atopobiaceae bacterium]|nr:class II glutamine amidotransferase [Atopobiaceae bacterium]MBR1830541.1 class II glutamine amidotransferase [Atopobiaceae bacterium]